MQAGDLLKMQLIAVTALHLFACSGADEVSGLDELEKAVPELVEVSFEDPYAAIPPLHAPGEPDTVFDDAVTVKADFNDQLSKEPTADTPALIVMSLNILFDEAFQQFIIQYEQDTGIKLKYSVKLFETQDQEHATFVSRLLDFDDHDVTEFEEEAIEIGYSPWVDVVVSLVNHVNGTIVASAVYPTNVLGLPRDWQEFNGGSDFDISNSDSAGKDFL